MANLEDLTKPQLIQIIKTYNKELKIAFTNRTKQELIDIIKSFMNVYEGYIETKPKKIVTEKPKLKKVKDPLKELIGQRGALRGEIEKYKSELENMNEELKYDLKLKKDKSFVDNYKQKIKDVNKLILMLKEVNKQISKLEVKPKVKEDIIERLKRDEERYKKEDEKHQEMLKLIEKTDKLVKQKPKEQPKKKEQSKKKEQPKKKEEPKEQPKKKDDEFERMYKVLKREDIKLQLDKDKAKYVYDKYGFDMLILVNNILYDLDKKNPSITNLDKLMENIKENIYSGPKKDLLPDIYYQIRDGAELDIFDNISNTIDDEGIIEDSGYDIDEVENFKGYYNNVKVYAEKLLKKK